YRNIFGNHGFVYNLGTGTYFTIDHPGVNVDTEADGINNAGQIVGRYDDASGRHGFLYFGGVFTTIQQLASRDSIARGINNFGQIVGEYTDNNGAGHGFLYNPSNGSFTTLDDPLASHGTVAMGINDLGQIVGLYVDSRLIHHGFLYSGGAYTPLPSHNSTNTEGTGINHPGVISGNYLGPLGDEHGFILTITPNPPPPAGTTADMILRHGADGQYEIYDIGNNSLLAAFQLGQVGTDWKFVGLGGFFGNDTTDMLL